MKDCSEMCKINLCFVASLLCLFSISHSITYKLPTVAISILVRNKEHTLPYFLSCINRLEYPKDRMYIGFYSENNEDDSMTLLEAWIKEYGHEYNNVYIATNASVSSDISATEWDDERFRHIIHLRETALNFARNNWADYIFMIDADVFLTDVTTLTSLILKNKTVVAPMLTSDGLYSNYWCGMNENYYYKRTDNYKPILNRIDVGCFVVPMVHTAVLINLNDVKSDMLTYNPDNVQHYDGPLDDIITFALNAVKNGIDLHICNDLNYGFITVPSEDDVTESIIVRDKKQLLNAKLNAIAHGSSLPLDKFMAQYVQYPTPSTLGFDRIYVINLERRVERRNLMIDAFRELGIEFTLVKAVDGRELNPEELSRRSIKLMLGYEDPLNKRPIKMGEIGCFLSHYNIWKEISDNNFSLSLILEDDIRFEPYFREKLAQVLEELKYLSWDLIYVGRKILIKASEEVVSDHVVRPLYSYWTLGYALTLQGARKLLAAQPLQHLLPVDEFLPIMFNQHPNDTWKNYFEQRNLIALSASPLLVNPTHYTGQPGYISDTELSDVVDIDLKGYIRDDL